MLIRPALASDAPGIAAVHVRSWQTAYRGLMPQEVLDGLSIPQREEGWRRILSAATDGATAPASEPAEPHARTIVADDDGRIAGWASYGDPREEAPSGTGELWGIYADPDHWSRGVGHALITAVEEAFRADGRRRAYLWVLAGNDRAASFYERHGWIEDGGTKVDERPGLVLHERRRVIALA
ncbi:N-acetyltransferase family protein [Microbacterium resistens]